MPHTTLLLRIKKDYVPALIADLIKADAVEVVEADEAIKFTAHQEKAVDNELEAIACNPNYIQKWEDVKHRLQKP